MAKHEADNFNMRFYNKERCKDYWVVCDTGCDEIRDGCLSDLLGWLHERFGPFLPLSLSCVGVWWGAGGHEALLSRSWPAY